MRSRWRPRSGPSRGRTVIWSGLLYPGDDGGAVEEVRFRLEQYLGEIERAYADVTADRRGARAWRPVAGDS
ncbi:hypothetical protein [Actinacidiphila glaucinigra]|uniref:hypothetical protein n=1 Tax=Actinacidiphila glaucinigra TaxID=235986 RepID=UPI0035DF0164